jgi:hypothetical protein
METGDFYAGFYPEVVPKVTFSEIPTSAGEEGSLLSPMPLCGVESGEKLSNFRVLASR